MHAMAIALLSLGASACCAAPGMTCELAKSSAEKLICSAPELLRRDAELVDAYGRLRRHDGVHKSSLVASQKKWLSRRDACQADEPCLEQAYVERISELQGLLRIAESYRPDSVDLMAAESLRQSIAEAMSGAPEFPAEKVIGRLEITQGVTRFSNMQPDTGDESRFQDSAFPGKRPAGVTQAEWKALLVTGVEGGGENGVASYVLIDLDRDGYRDLVVESYTGGTGLFTSVSLLKGGPRKFVGNVYSATSDATNEEPLFSLNGRGANQAYRWIALNGRVYAAYTEGYYGADTIYLIRPFTRIGSTPAIKIEYAYQFTVPASQGPADSKAELDLKTADSLRRAIAPLSQAAGSAAKVSEEHAGPICPSVENRAAAEPETSYGPGHYSYEVIADFPVWLDGECHLGRAVNWFGAYNANDGLRALMWVRKPMGRDEEAEPPEKEFQLHARRKAVRVSSMTSAFGAH